MKRLLTVAILVMISAVLTIGQTETNKVNQSKSMNQTSSTTAATYDFTTGSDKYYGGANGATELESGVWGMIAGDADQNGGIGSSDLISTRADLGLTEYNVNDVDMNGGVGSSDLILVRQNLGKTTQLP